MRDVAKKNMKPMWKVKGFFNRTSWKVSDVQIVRYTWVLSLSLCCLCLCVCCVLRVVCCGGGGGRREERGETNRTIWLLIPARASIRRAGVEQLYEVKRVIGGIGDMLFSIYSQT